jgi:tRNA threonylcarbamoyladenosine biosynthesis protein TsaE
MSAIILANAKETAVFAKTFAKTLKGGEVIGLIGDLGAGKTTFVQALGKALGVRERMTSPTFVYFHEHRLKNGPVRTFIHADAYRTDAKGLRGIGIDEYFDDPSAVTVIEWADRAKSILPKGAKIIRFRHLGGDRRSLTLKG